MKTAYFCLSIFNVNIFNVLWYQPHLLLVQIICKLSAFLSKHNIVKRLSNKFSSMHYLSKETLILKSTYFSYKQRNKFYCLNIMGKNKLASFTKWSIIATSIMGIHNFIHKNFIFMNLYHYKKRTYLMAAFLLWHVSLQDLTVLSLSCLLYTSRCV